MTKEAKFARKVLRVTLRMTEDQRAYTKTELRQHMKDTGKSSGQARRDLDDYYKGIL